MLVKHQNIPLFMVHLLCAMHKELLISVTKYTIQYQKAKVHQPTSQNINLNLLDLPLKVMQNGLLIFELHPYNQGVPGLCFPWTLNYLSLMVLLFWQVDRIKLSHDHTGYGSGFFVEEVEVEVPARQDRVKFPCRCWLAQDVDDGKIEREMFAVTPLPSK